MKNILATAAVLLLIVAPAAAQNTTGTVITDQNGNQVPASAGAVVTDQTGKQVPQVKTNSPKAAPSTDTTGSVRIDPNTVDDGTGQNSSPMTEDSSQGGDRAVGGAAH